uniref:CCHC-type domain-containing protein n=1 Tax=Xenopus tropicalis TaxID=8364 RepID=A0A803JJS5_XENTR
MSAVGTSAVGAGTSAVGAGMSAVGVGTSAVGAGVNDPTGAVNATAAGVSAVNEVAGVSGQSFANIVRGKAKGPGSVNMAKVAVSGARVGDKPAVGNYPRRGRIYPADSGRRRNVVRLQWEGEGPLPEGNNVIDKICDMGFTANDIYCFVHNKVFKDYTISFMRPQELDEFWEKFRDATGMWEGFRAVPVSRPGVCKVTILIENESIPPADLKIWLRRYGDVIGELERDFGYRGIWTGGWQAKVRLRTVGNVTQHIPSSAYIGRDLVCCFYPGQPRECWKCGSTRHFSISCDVLKCAMCLGVGHVAKHCPKSIRCNLCGELGHAYGSCPMSWQSIEE